jgi:hypothetical protein
VESLKKLRLAILNQRKGNGSRRVLRHHNWGCETPWAVLLLPGPGHYAGCLRRNSVRITEVLKEREERRELATDGCTPELMPLQVLPPGEHVRAGHLPELLRPADPHQPHVLVDVTPVGPPRISRVGSRFSKKTNELSLKQVRLLRKRPIIFERKRRRKPLFSFDAQS